MTKLTLPRNWCTACDGRGFVEGFDLNELGAGPIGPADVQPETIPIVRLDCIACKGTGRSDCVEPWRPAGARVPRGRP